MTKYYNNTDYSGYKGFSKRPRRIGKLILKICLWTILALVVVAACIFWGYSEYLRPDNIARLIEKESAKYLKADIKIGKMDYKLWRSYPWLEFEVDSITIISKSLDDVSPEVRSQLPSNSDFLASVNKISGKINIHSLLHKEMNLKDIEVEQPKVNLVMVNDSVTNFNIATPMKQKMEMPDIDISEINVTAPVDFSFFSLEDDVEAKLDVESFYLAREDAGSYRIGFDGAASGRYREYELPGQVPLKFTTGITPHPGELSLDLDDLALSLAGVTINAKGKVMANTSGINLQNAELGLRIDDLFSLLNYIPKQFVEKIPLPDGLSGFLPLSLETKLLAPFHIPRENPDSIKISDLPPINLQVRIDDANIEIKPPYKKRIVADDIYLLALAQFDPLNSENNFFRIEDLHLHGEGISLSGFAEVDNLTGEQQQFHGNFYLKSPVMETLTYLVPNSGFKLSGFLNGQMEFSGNAINLGRDGIKDIVMKGDIKSHSFNMNSASIGSVRLNNMEGDYYALIPEYPMNNYQGTKLDFEFKADTIAGMASGMNYKLESLDMKLHALDTVAGTPDPSGLFTLKTQAVKLSSESYHFFVNNLFVNAKGELNTSGPPSNYTTVSPTVGLDDALIAKHVDHTPLVLEYNGGGILGTIIGMINMKADIITGKGGFKSSAYLYPVEFSGLNLLSDLNSLQFAVSDFKIGDSGLSLSGRMEGMAPFLTSYSATPLKIVSDINFTNVDINQLSWGYYGTLVKQDKDSVFYVSPMLPYTAADSAMVAIPKNIDAEIRLKANSAEYMGYRFSPLSTSILVKNGDATLRKLTIGTPYATAVVDWTYSTRRLDEIFMNLDAQIKDFSFTPFYQTFPEILKDASQMENLTGQISADIHCHFDMFPSMFMNPESLEAKFDVRASNMEFARQGRIEKITHLMLIEGEAPIRIQNMNITGSFHNSILQLNPFKIVFDGYQLNIGGIMNTNGKMYYHLALEKSPFHLPFGVSLLGSIKHPEVNVGGTRINDYKTEMVGIDNGSKLDVNIMTYLHHGWLMFVQEAAKYQQKIEKASK